MHLNLRSFTALAGLAALAGAAFGDAYAEGSSTVGASLYNVGVNAIGGSGNQISVSMFSVVNPNFIVLFGGPGSESQSVGGGLINGGFDGGSGMGWSYYGQNFSSGNTSQNWGWSDASNVFGTANYATEDTYNELVYAITNTSATSNEWFDLEIQYGVMAQVQLDNSATEFGEDEALQQFGYTNSQGSFTGNTSTNTAYALTGNGFGAGFGTDTFAFVQNDITDFYLARLKPGQTVYFGVLTENFSSVGAAVSTPSPAAVVPFVLGLLGAARRRRKNS